MKGLSTQLIKGNVLYICIYVSIKQKQLQALLNLYFTVLSITQKPINWIPV